MEPISLAETEPKVESVFSRSQAIQLEILKENISEKYGIDADFVEEFLKAPPGRQWPIFTLLYPKAAFLIDSIVDVIREVDKIFVSEYNRHYDLQLYGIQSSLLYPVNDRIDLWQEKFDDIIVAGPSSGLWGDTVRDFKEEGRKTVDGSLIDQMNSSLAELPDVILSQLEKTIGHIKVRFDFLASRMAMLERYETEYLKESQEGESLTYLELRPARTKVK
ncbi:hypothetical protein BKA64DRAFT_108008 [Cadophora sp. MPI-SDFR-AT-0126]|nr:hypothetical protein BKA64DRAFT_108008 [Leotiomycetes sp. MPI-SDFR-AT-0126]